MEHINITFPTELKIMVDREAMRESTKRSTFIQKAVRVYIELKRQHALKELLKEGYEEIASECTQLTADFKRLDRESWKYAD